MPKDTARADGLPDEVEPQDVSEGLWIWRLRHPHWNQGLDWQPTVTSVCVDSGGEVLLLDPLVPPAGSSELWVRLNRRPPTAAAVLKPDPRSRHRRRRSSVWNASLRSKPVL